MLQEIDSLFPQQERLYQVNSPHKKHYPRLHALMQNNPPILQSPATVSVSSVGVRSVSGQSARVYTSDSKNSTRSTRSTNSSSSTKSKSTKSSKSVDQLNSHGLKPDFKHKFKLRESTAPISLHPEPTLSPSTDTFSSSHTSIQTPNTIALSTSIPHNSDGESIAFLSTDEEADSNEEDMTSPMQLQSIKSGPPTTGISIQAASVPSGYSPAMMNLQSVLPTPTRTSRRSNSFDSMGSAETNASIQSLANHPLSPPKNNNPSYGERRKSAPFIMRQSSGAGRTSQSNASFTSTKSGHPKSFTLTSFFTNAWAGVSGKTNTDEYEDDPPPQDDDIESDSDNGLNEIFSTHGTIRDRRKSTSSARLSLQKIMNIDESNLSLK